MQQGFNVKYRAGCKRNITTKRSQDLTYIFVSCVNFLLILFEVINARKMNANCVHTSYVEFVILFFNVRIEREIYSEI